MRKVAIVTVAFFVNEEVNMWIHVIWFLAVILVASHVRLYTVSDANEEIGKLREQRVKAESDLRSATLARDLWISNAQDWKERYDKECNANTDLVLRIMQQAQPKAPSYDEDIEDPPSVGEADAAFIEAEKVKRLMKEMEGREPLSFADDEAMPAMRVTQGDDDERD